MAVQAPPLDSFPVKGNSLVVGLVFVLAAVALGVSGLALRYVILTSTLGRAQSTVNQVEIRQNRLKSLVAEAVDYSQRNPAINPLLYSIGAKAAPAGSATAGSAPTPSR